MNGRDCAQFAIYSFDVSDSNQTLIRRAQRMRPPDLPNYTSPPVVEVALGIQFAPLERFRTIHSALVWQAFAADFPEYAEQPPLDPRFEIVGTVQREAPPFRLEFPVRPPLPRLWFLKRDDTQLVQFQIDRLLHNWRKVAVDDVYPRYEHIREQFVAEVGRLEAVLREHDLGSIDVNQCEVTYVNHISTPPARVADVLSFIRSETLSSSHVEVEGVAAQIRFILRTPEADPVGRLTVNAQPSTLPDGSPTLSVTLTARGAPIKANIDGALQFLDLGRDAIVKTFTNITTGDMHQNWGRTQ